MRPFNPDSNGDEEATPPSPPPRKKVNGINSLRLQSERNYVPAEGLNPAAELLRRRQEARRERGESGGGGGGGWFAGLGLSAEAKAARDQAQAAARARTAEEAEAFKGEILAQTAERQSQKAAVLEERDRVEAEKAELRAAVLERSRCEMALDKVTKRLAKNLQVDLELYRYSGRGRREGIDSENAACVEELSELIGEAERTAVAADTVAGAREALAQLEQAAESRAAISES